MIFSMIITLTFKHHEYYSTIWAIYTSTKKLICFYNTLKWWIDIFIERLWNFIAGDEESDEMISLQSNSCKSLEGK